MHEAFWRYNKDGGGTIMNEETLYCLTEDCENEWEATVVKAPFLVCLDCADDLDCDVLAIRRKSGYYVIQ